MYLRIAFGSLLIAFCLGESSKPAVSSISVHREDVPLSYKYSAIHIYSTENPRQDVIPSPLKLIANQNENLYTQAFIGNQNKVHTITSRENPKSLLRQLEPREHYNNKTFRNKPVKSTPIQIISGYNIDPSTLNELKSNDNKFLLGQLNNDHVTKLIKSPVVNLNIDMNESLRLKTLHNIFEKKVFPDEKPIKTVQVLLAMEKAQIQPGLEYAKMPHLHLNVARSYNIARTPYKAPLNEYKNDQRNSHKTRLEHSSLFYQMPNIKLVS